MKVLPKIIFVLALFAPIALLGVSEKYRKSSGGLKIDEMAPFFKGKNSLKEEVNLSDFKGKIVVMEFYNHECPFVRKHYDTQNMQNLQRRFSAMKDVVWLQIISSAPGKQGHMTESQAVANLTKEGAVPAHVILDPTGNIGKLYHAKTTPHMYVIDKEGVLRYQGAIDSVRSYRKDDVQGATNYVAEALTSLSKNSPVAVKETEAYGCSIKYAN